MADFRYPLTVIDDDADYLLVNVVDYQPPGLGSGGGGFADFFDFNGGSSRNKRYCKKNTKSRIILPIPEGVRDMNATSWRGDSLNSIQAAAIRSGQRIVESGGLNGAEANAQNVLQSLQAMGGTAMDEANNWLSQLENNSEVRDAVKTYFISQAANVFGANVSANSLISRTNGQVLNPNLELLFDGVQLRQFDFSIPFTPRNEQEALQCKGIINTFKRAMAAKTSGSGASRGVFISSPDVFKLEFRKGKRKHPFYFSMKICALKGMNVNYMETQQYATYEDGTPVKMRMNLQFTEVNPVYEEDYNQEDYRGVGY